MKSIILLAIVAMLSIVGLLLMFNGGITGKAYDYIYQPIPGGFSKACYYCENGFTGCLVSNCQSRESLFELSSNACLGKIRNTIVSNPCTYTLG